MTARRGDRVASLLLAVLLELPLAALLIGGTLRIVRLSVPPFSHGMTFGEFVNLGRPRRRRR
jgi:hypothetical protein